MIAYKANGNTCSALKIMPMTRGFLSVHVMVSVEPHSSDVVVPTFTFINHIITRLAEIKGRITRLHEPALNNQFIYNSAVHSLRWYQLIA